MATFRSAPPPAVGLQPHRHLDHPAEATDPGYWVRHLRQPVRFSDGLQGLLSDPNRVFLEVGPGQTLGSLVRAHPGPDGLTPPRAVLASTRHPQAPDPDLRIVLTALGRLWAAGISVDWARLHAGAACGAFPSPPTPSTTSATGSSQASPSSPRAPPAPTARPRRGRSAGPDPPARTSRTGSPAPYGARCLSRGRRPDPEPRRWLVFAAPEALGAATGARLRATGKEVVGVFRGRTSPGPGTATTCSTRGRPPATSTCWPSWPAGLGAPADPAPLVGRPGTRRRAGGTAGDGGAAGSRASSARPGPGRRGAGRPAAPRRRHGRRAASRGRPRGSPRAGCRAGPGAGDPPGVSRGHLPERRRRPTLDGPPAGDDRLDRSGARSSPRLAGAPAEAVVAYRGDTRLVERFEPTVVPAPGAAATARLRQRGVYLISGGLGGIGLVQAEHLARAVQARLVLVGRSGLPPREEWDAWLATHTRRDTTSRRIRQVQTWRLWARRCKSPRPTSPTWRRCARC